MLVQDDVPPLRASDGPLDPFLVQQLCGCHGACLLLGVPHAHTVFTVECVDVAPRYAAALISGRNDDLQASASDDGIEVNLRLFPRQFKRLEDGAIILGA